MVSLSNGHLSVEDGVWTFAYANEFKQQQTIKPLIDFPNAHKVYTSKTLWPFFSIRIPSLAQPSVQKVLQEENIAHDNTVGLLKRFGEKTIANPFRLAVAS